MSYFYFSTDSHTGLKDKLKQEHDKDRSRLITSINGENKDTVEIRIGRYGVYAQINEDRVTIEKDIIPSEVSVDDIAKMIKAKNAAPTEFGADESGEKILLKNGRFGPYVQCGKKMKSLPPGVTDTNLTEDIAKEIVSMPREIGIDTNTKNSIVKDIGRYGPYLKCGKNNRKISAPDDILSITLDRAIELFATDAKQRSVLKNLGQIDEMDIVVKDGRYGIYVTNGKVNVTLPKDIDYNTLDLQTALELIKNKKPKKRFYKSK